jgi:hypothetical protein
MLEFEIVIVEQRTEWQFCRLPPFWMTQSQDSLILMTKSTLRYTSTLYKTSCVNDAVQRLSVSIEPTVLTRHTLIIYSMGGGENSKGNFTSKNDKSFQLCDPRNHLSISLDLKYRCCNMNAIFTKLSSINFEPSAWIRPRWTKLHH